MNFDAHTLFIKPRGGCLNFELASWVRIKLIAREYALDSPRRAPSKTIDFPPIDFDPVSEIDFEVVW